jgi:hypothetical protein
MMRVGTPSIRANNAGIAAGRVASTVFTLAFINFQLITTPDGIDRNVFSKSPTKLDE